MKQIIYSFLFLLVTAVTGYGQSTIKGEILDEDKVPLIGATVIVKGTTVGTVTDAMGKFSLTVPEGRKMIEVQYVGYETKTVTLEQINAGAIKLAPDAFGLDEVVVTGVMDIVRDRRTPVAVSTIPASEIQAKAVGNVELPEVAKATPSIFVSNQAGGYGDAQVFTRGFDQTNTAFLLNGQPINGMEDGKMYWSNWSGLTDVASAVQIQRGLGASKLAISSVGGTWNFVMKATDNKKGGNAFATVGNDNYRKVGASFSTGMMNDKFGLTVLLSAWSGDGWAHGTRGQGQTYFISAGYKPAANHTINLLVTGAPQWHDQKFSTSIYAHEDADGEIDPKYNSNWGIYDGDYLTERRNYYHKPILNLNWDWAINDRSSFSTVLYGSVGRGGGTGGLGGGRVRTESGLINFDATAADPDASYIIRASVNAHNWVGAVLKYERDLLPNLNFSLGSDLRRYVGDHFRQSVNFLGRGGYDQRGVPRYPDGYRTTTEYKADPWAALGGFAPKGDRLAYNNSETIKYAGLFTQLEYFKGGFSAYLQGSLSSQSHVRHEHFYELEANEDSEKVTNNGFNAKLGLSYAIDDKHSVFVNTGLYSRQPFHDAIYVGNSNVVNENTNNEDIIGIEVGYKFTSNDFYANLNYYRTAWNERVEFNGLQVQPDGTTTLTNNETYTAIGMDPYELLYQDQLHSGIELDLGYNVSDRFRLKGFASLGNWEVIGDRDVEVYDGDGARNKVRTYSLAGDNIKVGEAPQTSFGLGARVGILEDLSAELNYIYYSDLYARNGGIELPSYGLLDLNVGYTVALDNGNLLRFGANIYNLLDELYISRTFSSDEASEDPTENWNGINKSNSVTFGKTRTWNLTMKYSF